MSPSTPFDLATCQRPWVRATRIAEYMDCDVRTIIAMAQDATDPLHGEKVGRHWRISVESARARFHVPQKPTSAA